MRLAAVFFRLRVTMEEGLFTVDQPTDGHINVAMFGFDLIHQQISVVRSGQDVGRGNFRVGESCCKRPASMKPPNLRSGLRNRQPKSY